MVLDDLDQVRRGLPPVRMQPAARELVAGIAAGPSADRIRSGARVVALSVLVLEPGGDRVRLRRGPRRLGRERRRGVDGLGRRPRPGPGRVVEACHGQPARATVAAFVEPGGVTEALADIDRLELELASEARALPGARELVAALPVGRWALCTSGNRVLATARLAASGIDPPPVFITADDVARGKPDPEGYALAVRRLGADPADSVVIEDAPNGIVSARAAGVGTVIGVGTRARDADVDAEISDLRSVTWDGKRLRVAGEAVRDA